MGRKEQSLDAAKALKMIRRPGACKEDLLYAIANVTGPGSEAVCREAQAMLPNTRAYGEQPALQPVNG